MKQKQNKIRKKELKTQTKLETVSIAEPLQNGSMRKTPNAVNTSEGGGNIHREEGREGDVGKKVGREG